MEQENKEKRKYTKTKYSDVLNYAKTYTRIKKSANGGLEWHYHFNFEKEEPLDTPHVPGSTPEYLRYRSDRRLVYVEDISKRERIVRDESKIGHRGRPFGSKDSYKRKRHNKNKGE